MKSILVSSCQKSLLFIFLLLSSLAFAERIVPVDTALHAMNFRVDSLTMKGSWDFPGIILLNEGFENAEALPSGWQSFSEETPGWIRSDCGTSMNFLVNNHGHYMVSNDFNAGQSHDGCCDRLITPLMDLSTTDSAVLSFNSRYTGAFNEIATVEISFDGGQNWTVVKTIVPQNLYNGEWNAELIDLSAYTGLPGGDAALICFHADDNGQQASGWAVDDVMVIALATGLQGFSLWLDDSFAGTTTGLDWQFNPSGLPLGSPHKARILANYGSGTACVDSVYFSDWYLPFPDSLSGMANISEFQVHWTPPDFSAVQLQDEFLFYRLYVNDSLMATVPKNEVQYSFSIPESARYCLKLVAVYDLSSLGFPGVIVESKPAGPECYEVWYCCNLPFFEDWSAGTFSLNNWTPGDHWIIAPDEGLPAPAARFNSQPATVNYSEDLVMFPRISPGNTATPHDVFLEFDLKLDDIQSGQTEKLSFYWKVQGGEWELLVNFVNSGSFDWTHYKCRLGTTYQPGVICFRVVASGENTQNIDHWLLDNIKLYVIWGINPPVELTATPEAGQQKIFLEWKTPSDSLVYKSGTSANDLISYSVFRRSREPELSNWINIGTTTATWFEDTGLTENCYDYYVSALYTENTADSDIDSLNCLEVGLPDAETHPPHFYFDAITKHLTVSLNQPAKSLVIYDITGRKWLEKSPVASNEISLDLGHLPEGLYTIRIQAADGTLFIHKLIRE